MPNRDPFERSGRTAARARTRPCRAGRGARRTGAPAELHRRPARDRWSRHRFLRSRRQRLAAQQRRTGDSRARCRCRERRLDGELLGAVSALTESQRLGQLGSFTFDPTTHAFTHSDQLRRNWGLEPDDDISVVADRLVHPDDRELVQEQWERALTEGGHREYLHRIVRPNGEVRYLRTNLEVSLDATGRAEMMHGSQLDVTDLTLAKQEAQRASAFLDAVLAASPDYTFVTDLASRRPADCCGTPTPPRPTSPTARCSSSATAAGAGRRDPSPPKPSCGRPMRRCTGPRRAARTASRSGSPDQSSYCLKARAGPRAGRSRRGHRVRRRWARTPR